MKDALLMAFSQLLLIHSFADLPLPFSTSHPVSTPNLPGGQRVKPQNTLWSRLTELKPLSSNWVPRHVIQIRTSLRTSPSATKASSAGSECLFNKVLALFPQILLSHQHRVLPI